MLTIYKFHTVYVFFFKWGNIKFYFKLRKTAAKTLECLSIVYGGEALKKTANYNWFIRLKDSYGSLEDTERNWKMVEFCATVTLHIINILQFRNFKSPYLPDFESCNYF